MSPELGKHSLRIEALVNQIIFGPPDQDRKLGDDDFIPTSEEAAYLLSAIYLHDIDMIYGIFPGEDSNSGDTN